MEKIGKNNKMVEIKEKEQKFAQPQKNEEKGLKSLKITQKDRVGIPFDFNGKC
jgi:hypothetical protein